VSLGPTSFFYLPSVPINNQVYISTVAAAILSDKRVIQFAAFVTRDVAY